MKFLLLNLGFAIAALAAPAPSPVENTASNVQRDNTVVSPVLVQIEKLTSDFNKQIEAFKISGNSRPLTAASNNLLDGVSSGTSRISSSPGLTYNESIQVVNRLDSIVMVLNSTLINFASIRAQLTGDDHSSSSLVASYLQQLKNAFQKLGDTIRPKSTAGFQNILTKKTNELTGIVQKALSSYSGAPSRVKKAVSHVQRDYATVSSVITQCRNLISEFNQQISAYKSSGKIEPLSAAGNRLVDGIGTGAEKISGSSAVTLNEAFQISQQFDQFATELNATLTNLGTIRPQIIANGHASIIRRFLSNLKAAVQAFGDAIKSKVPSGAQPGVSEKVSDLVAIIQRAINSFS